MTPPDTTTWMLSHLMVLGGSFFSGMIPVKVEKRLMKWACPATHKESPQEAQCSGAQGASLYQVMGPTTTGWSNACPMGIVAHTRAFFMEATEVRLLSTTSMY